MRRFRPEIEGLRAIAAILVAIYHVWFGRVSGGVDVFFLIAGFLITTSLLGQVERFGRVDVRRYLSRLAKRLLPASVTVLFAVLIATRIWMPITRESATYSEVLASIFYLENWALASQAVDYLARETPSSPVQHFWAMSIQGQFYLIWLAVFAVALWIGRRNFRRSLTYVVMTLFVVSFVYSIYLTEANQPFAYFHTGTRVWEFAAGGLLALAITRIRILPGAWGALVSWVGLAMIVVTGFALPVADAFPGFVALWPLSGAALVLIGAGSRNPFGADLLLSSRPLVYIGGVSYGLYLWHWPVLTFYLLRSGEATAGPLAGVVIIASAFLLAILTTRFVERPIRSGTGIKGLVNRVFPRRELALPAVGIVSVLAMAAATVGMSAYADRGVSAQVETGSGDHPGAAVILDGHSPFRNYSVEPLPRLAEAADDRADVSTNGCHQGLYEPELITCEYGRADADVVVMLVGGSHSAHWFPALEVIADAREWRLVTATKSSCLFSTDPPGSGQQLQSCSEWNDALFAEIVEEAPDLVLMTATRGQGREEHVPEGYVQMWRALEDHDIHIAALRDTPRFDSNRIDCLAQHGIETAACDEPRELHLADENPTSEVVANLSNVSVIDLNQYFCDSTCDAVIGNVVVYYDAHHITATYARSVAPMFEVELVGVLDRRAA
ncbi:acyltransferase family protein [Pseudactinotalea sp. Z1748]|uniref:acyltransferase family protein n=1 Tax=Pseudactinotalea sp. Z1748 TaxID=3413027 RepID=UPI003C7DD9C0